MLRKIQITKEQIKRAKNYYKFGALKDSITKGKGNLIGSIGEIVVSDYYKLKGFKVDDNSTFQNDLRINGFTIDIKTRPTKYPPQKNYEIRLPYFNTHQKTNFYYFVLVDLEFKNCWLAGYIKKDTFFKKAKFCKKGMARHDGWKYRCNTYVLNITELEQIK